MLFCLAAPAAAAAACSDGSMLNCLFVRTNKTLVDTQHAYKRNADDRIRRTQFRHLVSLKCVCVRVCLCFILFHSHVCTHAALCHSFFNEQRSARVRTAVAGFNFHVLSTAFYSNNERRRRRRRTNTNNCALTPRPWSLTHLNILLLLIITFSRCAHTDRVNGCVPRDLDGLLSQFS